MVNPRFGQSKFLAVAALLVVAGCAQQPASRPIGFPQTAQAIPDDGIEPLRSGTTVVQASEDGDETLEERARRVFATQPPPAANLPDQALDQELLFKFLLSEIAGQPAVQGFLDRHPEQMPVLVFVPCSEGQLLEACALRSAATRICAAV